MQAIICIKETKKVVKTQSISQRKLSTEILRFYIFQLLTKLFKKEVNDRNIMLVPTFSKHIHSPKRSSISSVNVPVFCLAVLCLGAELWTSCKVNRCSTVELHSWLKCKQFNVYSYIYFSVHTHTTLYLARKCQNQI